MRVSRPVVRNHTTVRVPTSTLGGVLSAEIISEMKLAVMPIIPVRQTTCRMRVTVNVAPRAPFFWLGMLIATRDEPLGNMIEIEGTGQDWICAADQGMAGDGKLRGVISEAMQTGRDWSNALVIKIQLSELICC